MADVLQRAQAPLTTEEWERLDKIVLESARQRVVGRRFLSLVGPLGIGYQFVPRLALSGDSGTGTESNPRADRPVSVQVRTQVPLALVHKDAVLHWRDLEAARQTGLPLDMGTVAAAAAICAGREDDLIFSGDKSLGLDGLTTVAGHRTMTRRDWGVGGHGFLDIVDAVDHMTVAGFPGPYALVCSPNLYACLLRVYGGSGVLELTQVRELCSAGVFQSAHVKSALLVAVGEHNVDLAIGCDLTAAYLGTNDMDYVFRVLETVALRIKRPGAVCTLLPRTASPTHRVRRGVPEEALGTGD